jgi:hypothetical protein
MTKLTPARKLPARFGSATRNLIVWGSVPYDFWVDGLIHASLCRLQSVATYLSRIHLCCSVNARLCRICLLWLIGLESLSSQEPRWRSGAC